MPNSLIVPVSAALYFDREAPFSTRISPLSTAVRLAYDNVGALTVTSFVTGASAIERFRVEGTQGSLFSVTDVLTGVLFSVNDISGLPILTVQDTDTIIGGAFNTNTLVVSGTRVGIGVNTGTTKVTVSGGLSASGTIFASGGNSDQWNSTYQTVSSLSALWMNAGTALYTVTADNFTITNSSSWAVNTTSKSITGTLPTSPSSGVTIRFLDAAKTWGNTNRSLVIVRSGQLIESLTENLNCDISGYSFSLTFVGGSVGWRLY